MVRFDEAVSGGEQSCPWAWITGENDDAVDH